jgi:pyruvate dehydrogenase complex dehydrogenase (E1) component
MHPTALAKRTHQSNQAMVDEVQALADLLGIPEVTEPLAKIKPSVRQPAVTALREREALTGVLAQIREKMVSIISPPIQELDSPPERLSGPDTPIQGKQQGTQEQQEDNNRTVSGRKTKRSSSSEDSNDAA